MTDTGIILCVQLDVVSSEDVSLSILHHRLKSATDVEEQRELKNRILELLQVTLHFSVSTHCPILSVLRHLDS